MRWTQRRWRLAAVQVSHLQDSWHRWSDSGKTPPNHLEPGLALLVCSSVASLIRPEPSWSSAGSSLSPPPPDHPKGPIPEPQAALAALRAFLGILANIFMSLLLYLYEKYSDNDGLNMIMSDANRTDNRHAGWRNLRQEPRQGFASGLEIAVGVGAVGEGPGALTTVLVELYIHLFKFGTSTV